MWPFVVKNQDRSIFGRGIVMGIGFTFSVLSDSAVLGRAQPFLCGNPQKRVFWGGPKAEQPATKPILVTFQKKNRGRVTRIMKNIFRQKIAKKSALVPVINFLLAIFTENWRLGSCRLPFTVVCGVLVE